MKILVILAVVVIAFLVLMGQKGSAKNADGSERKQLTEEDYDVAVRYFGSYARFVIHDCNFQWRDAGPQQSESFAFRQEFLSDEEGPVNLSLLQMAKIEAHAISYVKHALRSGNGHMIDFAGTYSGFTNIDRRFKDDLDEIRILLMQDIR